MNRSLHLAEIAAQQLSSDDTKEIVKDLVDQVWALEAAVVKARNQAAQDMREAAVKCYTSFTKRDNFLDQDVIKALEALPLPDAS